jgi:hypothetical protein
MKYRLEMRAETFAGVEQLVVMRVTAHSVYHMARTITDYVAALVYAILMAGAVLGGFYGAHALMQYNTVYHNIAAGVVLCSMPVVIGWLLSQMSRLSQSR